MKIDPRELHRGRVASLRTLRRATSLFVTDAEILGGDPVFRGTRVPVHVIASMLEQGSAEPDSRIRLLENRSTEVENVLPRTGMGIDDARVCGDPDDAR